MSSNLGHIFSAGVALYNSFQQSKWSDRNYSLQKEGLEESKFMNRNQFQIQASDAQKAGINPLAMSGGSVQSASAQNVDAPQADGLLNVLGNIASMKHEDELQKKSQDFQADEKRKEREHEELLASMKIDAENKRHSESLAQSAKQFDANLEELKNYHSQIKEIEDSKLSNDEKRIKLEDTRLEMERSATDALNMLRRQQYGMNKTETLMRIRELGRESLTGFMKGNGGKLGAWINWCRDLGVVFAEAITKENAVDKFTEVFFHQLESESLRKSHYGYYGH